jgi:hypothetical protein
LNVCVQSIAEQIIPSSRREKFMTHRVCLWFASFESAAQLGLKKVRSLSEIMEKGGNTNYCGTGFCHFLGGNSSLKMRRVRRNWNDALLRESMS